MTPVYSEEKRSVGKYLSGCSSAYNRRDEIPQDQVIDAHALGIVCQKNKRRSGEDILSTLKRKILGKIFSFDSCLMAELAIKLLCLIIVGATFSPSRSQGLLKQNT